MSNSAYERAAAQRVERRVRARHHLRRRKPAVRAGRCRHAPRPPRGAVRAARLRRSRARVAAYPHHWTWMGQFGRFMRIAASEGCRDVVFIGSVTRPSLWSIRPDWRVLRLMPQLVRLYRGGDDHLQSGIGRLFEQHGFRLLGPKEIAPELTMPLGPLGGCAARASATAPTSRAGLRCSSAMSPFDIGQAVVVADNQVLARRRTGGHRPGAGPRRGLAPRWPHPLARPAPACWSRPPSSARTIASTCRPSARRPSRARPRRVLPASRWSRARPSSPSRSASRPRPIARSCSSSASMPAGPAP